MGRLNQFLFIELLMGVVGIMPAMAIFSDYGQIQNVQTYSSNPYWNNNGLYNQRTMPQPVYVNGAELSSGDCTRAVSALVASYCVTRNGCAMESLNDARPTIMVQLSQLPNHNYAGSCAGYIDSEFAKYKSARGNAGANGNTVTAFPTVPGGAVAFPTNSGLKNPYEQETPTWQSEVDARAAELAALQADNGAGSEHLVATAFPKTTADLSFGDRIANQRAGFAQYQDKKVYHTIDVGDADEYKEHYNNKKNVSQNQQSSSQTAGGTGENSGGNGNSGTEQTNVAGVTPGRTIEYDAATVADSDNSTGSKVGMATAAISSGAAGGAAVGAALTAWLGPGAAIGAGIGAVVGGIGGGIVALVSETDVLVDPITGLRVGCNIAVENADRKVEVGGYMFCGQYKESPDGGKVLDGYVPGYVRQCFQNEGNPSTKVTPVLGWFMYDFWGKGCKMRLCEGMGTPPADASTIEWQADTTNICWNWRLKQ